MKPVLRFLKWVLWPIPDSATFHEAFLRGAGLMLVVFIGVTLWFAVIYVLAMFLPDPCSVCPK